MIVSFDQTRSIGLEIKVLRFLIKKNDENMNNTQLYFLKE